MNVKKKLLALGCGLLMVSSISVAQTKTAEPVRFLGDRHAMVRIDAQKKYLLLPVEEKE